MAQRIRFTSFLGKINTELLALLRHWSFEAENSCARPENIPVPSSHIPRSTKESEEGEGEENIRETSVVVLNNV